MNNLIKKFLIVILSTIFTFFIATKINPLISNASTSPSVSYRTHVQNVGWQNYVSNGAMAGTTGKSLRLEGINIKISGIPNAKIKYQVHIQNIGWQGWKSNDQMAGTQGQSLRLEAIKIMLENSNDYSVMYRVHIQNIGWQDWKLDGELAGTTGKSLRLEAIEIKIVKKEIHISYRAHVQNIGWQDYVKDGKTAGTTGKSLRVEALNIKLINAPSNAKVVYKTHIQNIGWQDWKSNDQMSGTSGRALRVEAIKIKLENLDNYTVEYRVHVQNKGWTGWYIDGEQAGTTGQGLRIEAVEARLVPKYKRSYIGIDVSRWQPQINFDTLVSSKKIDFIITRVGWYSESQSKLMVDNTFENNYKKCKEKNIPIGTYFYSYATNVEGAKKEAQSLANYLKTSGYTNYNLPIFYDIEDKTQETLGKDTITKVTITFCETLKSLGFNSVGVYSSAYWLNNNIDISALPEGYSIWVADYGTNTGKLPENIYKYKDKYNIWQYTSKGTAPGISGDVDFNICYTKYF